MCYIFRESEPKNYLQERLQAFPEPVRNDIGHALYRVQIGEIPPSAKPMIGIESGVFETELGNESREV